MNVRRMLLPLLAAVLLLQAGFTAWQVVRSERILAVGEEFELRIHGYDPRDLLRGRYLDFRLTDIGDSTIPSWLSRDKRPGQSFRVRLTRTPQGYHDVTEKSMNSGDPRGWIRLRCDNEGDLVPPVSRFYLNEKDAAPAEKLLFSGKDVRIRVRYKGGQMRVTELLVDGKSLKAALRENP